MSAPAPKVAPPVTVVLMQVAPGAWTVELNIGSERRYISVGHRSRRLALESVVTWLEQMERVQ